MGIRERKTRQKASLRQEILDAAREILIHEGAEKLSMRRIASKIEYTPTTIYLYFKDKEDILFHLCEEVYGKVVDVLKKVERQEKDPVERVRKAIAAYIKFGLSDPARYRIAFMYNLSPDVHLKDLLKPGTKAQSAYEILRNGVAETLKLLKNDCKDAEAVAQVLWASTHGIISIVISHPDFPWVELNRMTQATIDLLMNGLIGKTAERK